MYIQVSMSEEKSFTFQNQRALLTYKTHLDKQKLEEFFNGLGTPLKFFRAAHETGDETTPYLHTHVLLHWTKRFQSKNCRIFDFENIHPHIKKVITNSHWKECVKYLGKEDAANADLLAIETPVAERVWDCKDIKEALSTQVKRLADVTGVIALYKHKPVETEPEERIKPRAWQQAAKDWIDRTHNDRAVVWLWERKGNAGKTKFLEFLEQEYTVEKSLFLTDFGRVTDTANIVQNAVERGWDGSVVLIDLRRSMKDRESIYPILEAFKDRRFTNTKYMGGCVRLRKCPKVIVTANWEPHWEALSEDRWRVVELEPALWEGGTALAGWGGLTLSSPPLRPRAPFEDILL